MNGSAYLQALDGIPVGAPGGWDKVHDAIMRLISDLTPAEMTTIILEAFPNYRSDEYYGMTIDAIITEHLIDASMNYLTLKPYGGAL